MKQVDRLLLVHSQAVLGLRGIHRCACEEGGGEGDRGEAVTEAPEQ